MTAILNHWSQLRAHGGETAFSRYTTMIHCFGSDFASCLSVNHGLVPCFGRSLLHDPSAGTSTISPVLCPWSKQINRASLPCLGTPAHGVYALGVPYCTPLKLPHCTPVIGVLPQSTFQKCPEFWSDALHGVLIWSANPHALPKM